MSTNRQKFLNEFNILHAAAVGVTVVKTREPFRVLDAIHEWSHVNRYPFKSYSMITGWNTYDPMDPNVAPTGDNNKDIMGAVAQIEGHGTSGTGFPDGVFMLFWPHYALPKLPPLVQMLAELARSCAENMKRIVLVVPPAFDIPSELQDSVAILDFDLPNRTELLDSYARVCEGVPVVSKRPQYQQADIDKILNAIVGMTEMEAESAVARAVAKYRDAFPRVPIDDFVATLMAVKVEVIRRSDVLEIMPVETMDNVGGLAALKEWAGLRKEAFSQAAREAGVDRPKGLLLVGPPGTGKTLAGKAIAHELGQPLIRFDLSRVYGSLVGQSEQRIREALKTLEAMAPCVVLLDEIDKAVGTTSGTNDGGVSSRILGAILTHMQESTAAIFWVCTANRTGNLPSELVRKGRLDEIFSVVLPSEEERRDIFRIHLRKRREDPDNITDLDAALTPSAGHVGAEIEAAVKEAKLIAFRTQTPLTGASIAAQFGHSKPLSEAFAEDFATMQKWAENNARPASGVTVQARSRSRSNPPPVGTPTVPVRPRGRAMVQDPSSLDS